MPDAFFSQPVALGGSKADAASDVVLGTLSSGSVMSRRKLVPSMPITFCDNPSLGDERLSRRQSTVIFLSEEVPVAEKEVGQRWVLMRNRRLRSGHPGFEGKFDGSAKPINICFK